MILQLVQRLAEVDFRQRLASHTREMLLRVDSSLALVHGAELRPKYIRAGLILHD